MYRDGLTSEITRACLFDVPSKLVARMLTASMFIVISLIEHRGVGLGTGDLNQVLINPFE